MQPLKLLVIVLGVVIVVGLAVVVVTVVHRMGGTGGGRAFETADLTLPKGCHVIGMASAGERLAVRLGDAPECQIILFVDPESGQQSGRVNLLTQP